MATAALFVLLVFFLCLLCSVPDSVGRGLQARLLDPDAAVFSSCRRVGIGLIGVVIV